MRSHAGVLRLAIAFAALLGSLSMVVWRQSRALELLREMDSTRAARAIGEAERSELARRVQYLESRARVVADAQARLGMRVPSAHEIVILPLGERSAAAGPAQLAIAAAARPGSQP